MKINKEKESQINKIKEAVAKKFNLSKQSELKYFVFSGTTSNRAYNPDKGKINILFKNGKLEDVAKASDQLNISVMSEHVVKHYLCYPKEAIT